MALQKITNKEIEEKQVASLPDRMTGTATENKAAFDALVKAVIEKYNEVIETLSGLSGAASIGAEPFAGVEGAATVQAQLQKLQENIAEAVAGSIPDASITTAKLADGAVDNKKLADEVVTEEKIKDAEVTAAKIRDLAITAAKLADLSITTAKLAEGAVTAEKLADGGVPTEKIADGAVTTEKLSVSNYAVIEAGTYTGTGTSGSSNKTKITASFVPKIVIVAKNTEAVFNSSSGGFIWLGQKTFGSGNASQIQFALSGQTLSWYHTYSTANAGVQANASGTKYFWVAIG